MCREVSLHFPWIDHLCNLLRADQGLMEWLGLKGTLKTTQSPLPQAGTPSTIHHPRLPQAPVSNLPWNPPRDGAATAPLAAPCRGLPALVTDKPHLGQPNPAQHQTTQSKPSALSRAFAPLGTGEPREILHCPGDDVPVP